MPTYNYKSRELIAKIVYYGPGRCGKTTNLQQIHQRMRPETRSELLSVATETDRTIYFDLLPLNLGTISGMKFMVRLFTVPGQVYYAETRKLVLRGADGIVFVADSQDHMMDENRQSLRDLRDNLAANGLDYGTIPLVLQWNKRDLPHLISEAELDATLNDRRVKTVNAIASQGEGVLETLRHITLAVFNHIKAGGKTMKPGRAAQNTPPGLQQGGAPGMVPPSSGTPSLPAMGMSMSGGMGTGMGIGHPAQAGSMQSGASSSIVGMPPIPSMVPSAVAAGSPGSTGEQARAGTPSSWSSALPRPSLPGSMPGGAQLPPPPPPSSPLPPPLSMASPVGAGSPTSGTGYRSQQITGTLPPLPPPSMGAPVSRMPPPPPPPAQGFGPMGGPPPREPARMPPPLEEHGSLGPHGPQPVRISVEMVLEEFQSLALAQSQLSERLATLESHVNRLGRENQEIREMLARR